MGLLCYFDIKRTKLPDTFKQIIFGFTSAIHKAEGAVETSSSK